MVAMRICQICSYPVPEGRNTSCPRCGASPNAVTPRTQQNLDFKPPVTAQDPDKLPAHGFKGPVSGNYQASLLLGVIGLLLLLMALSSPWYRYEGEMENLDEDRMSQWESTEDLSGYRSQVWYYDDGDETDFLEEEKDWSDEEDNDLGELYASLSMIMYVGLALGILGLCFLVLCGTVKVPLPWYRNLTLFLTFLAMVMVLAAALTAAGFHAHSYEASYAEDRDEGSEKILPEGPWGSFRGTKDQETRVYDDDYRSSSSWGPTLGWFFALASSFFWAAALVSFYQAWNKDQLGLAQGQNVNVIKGGTTGPRQEPQPRQQAYHGQSDFGAPRPRRVEKDRSVDRVERFSSYGGSSKAAPPPPQAPPTPPWQAQQPNYQWQPKSLVRKTRPRRGQGMDQPWSCQGCGSWQPGELMFCGSCRRRRGE